MEAVGMLVTGRPVAPVVIRREMAKNPAVVESLEPLERSIFMASTAKTVEEYSLKEIVGELAIALKWISKDVGYRITDESEMQYLCVRTAEILKRHYGRLTIKDFRLAFELCITGELDEFLPRGSNGQPDRGHYQQFNIEYVCKILNAYRKKRGQVLQKAHAARPEPEPERDAKLERFYREQTRRGCIAAFYFFKYHGYLPPMSPISEMLYYNVLAGGGLVDDIQVTLEEQQAILYRSLSEFLNAGRIADAARLKKEGADAVEIQARAFGLARRKALKKAFAGLVRDEIQITDYIKIDT